MNRCMQYNCRENTDHLASFSCDRILLHHVFNKQLNATRAREFFTFQLSNKIASIKFARELQAVIHLCSQ